MPLSEIERVGDRMVLQFDGELLPLEDEGELLADLEAAGSGEATVLICRRPGIHAAPRVGIVVRRVLDVAPGTVLPESAGMSSDWLAMVKGRVTAIHTEFAGNAAQEVA